MDTYFEAAHAVDPDLILRGSHTQLSYLAIIKAVLISDTPCILFAHFQDLADEHASVVALSNP
jgi:hypothetical protein